MKNLLLTIGLFAGLASYAVDNNAVATNNVLTASTTTKEVTESKETTTEANTTETTTAAAVEGSSFGATATNDYWQPGISSITELGASFMYNQRFVNIYQALGGRVNPYLFIGGGVGVQVKNSSTYQFQLLADVRVNA